MSHFILRTEDFDPRHRAAKFESVAANICKLAIEPENESYSSSTTIAVLPGAVIADTAHSPCRTRRTVRLAAETGDNILLHVPVTGGFTIRQERGTEVECRSGQIYLDPSEVPGVAQFVPETSRVIYVSIPRAALMAASPSFNPCLRQVVELTPQWRLLLAHARALHAEAGVLPPEQLQHGALHLQDLLLFALGADREADQIAQGRGVRVARLKAIKADVEANLPLNELNSDWIAARHRISARYVRSLFAQEGTSFPDYVAMRRLMLVRRQLSDPRHSRRSISQVALSAGFGDISWFNARFRATFGMTPSEMRSLSEYR
ncbi:MULTISPECIES: AraC family transcriptional regulator [unclassified Shinella]|uniref:AraC family transcriptional regulator n=1 Tax=unclassified Shinella TaxID=2643062 RepID=UPI000682502E|nr:MULTISPECIES: AraC family transcriptional regulator [unclassified Shinella]